jgi:RimJ/RimL family protein N-acetyltransferase
MINGNHITLRSLKKEDLQAINRWRNDLHNRILIQGYRGPVTMEVDSRWLDNVLENSNNRDVYFGIEKQPGKEFIGIIQLNEIDYISGIATCGILIGDEEERGRGIGVEAVRAVLYYAFFVLNLRKVITYIAAFNNYSFKVQNKVGKVHKEGCLKAHYQFKGQYVDIHIQSFFKEDYKELLDEYNSL